MKIYIKNMVCNRCIAAVKGVFENQNLRPKTIVLGEVTLEQQDLSKQTQDNLKHRLNDLGFELIEDKKTVLVTKIKAAIVGLVHHSQASLEVNLSDFLKNELKVDYTILAQTFSAVENNTIEKYYIKQKIEKVKEYISYGELTLSEIAYKLNYSSVAHLSAQFKKETGLTPTTFKQNLKRKTLDLI